MRRSAPLRDLMHFLGHSHLSRTAVYQDADEEAARRISALGNLRSGAGLEADAPAVEKKAQG